jgi:hypothetical protein
MAINHIEGIVDGMSHIQARGRIMNSRVIKSAWACMVRERDIL